MCNKKLAQRIHAKKRAEQRYGLILNRHDIRNIIKLIQTGKGTPVEKRSLRVTTFIVSYNNEPVKVVYDSKRHNIVTFLPNAPVV